jgi:hypothetical protein
VPTPRLFTLREAEATLPLVRRIVADLMAAYPRWQELVARYEVLTGPLKASDGEPADLVAVREGVAHEAERINGYLQELEALGCVFKGFDAGLVDFYALHGDRLVFLCWRQGEEHITHWHEVDAGFAGRQPVEESMFTETVHG